MEEQDSLPFDPSQVKLENSIIRPITRRECEPIITEYEWLGYLPLFTKYYFGLFFVIDGKECLGGVVAYQPEYGDNMGIWDKYGFTGKILQLSRGVCLWWTPKNSASYFISRTNKWIKNNTHYRIITATVDEGAGEIGTIYQSLNWHYLGSMDGNMSPTGKERIRYGYLINGKLYNQRQLRKMYGTAKHSVIKQRFPDVIIKNIGRKKRYFTFLGSKTENKKYYSTIKSQIKPYMNRSDHITQ